MIVMGGTISSLPREQVTEFIKGLYDGLNGFVSDSLDSSMKANEVAEHRCIGLTLETRPDYVSKEECVFFRSLGCTRIEMGVQSIYNDVLDLTNRGHHIERVMKACKTFKDYGFKVNFHIMPGLPGSTPEKDIEMMDVLFKEPNLCPDMIKIYPCVVFKNAELYDWYKSGKFVPYTNKEIVETIAKMKEKIPKQVRLMRLGRVLPGGVAESYDRVDIRQEVESYMKERGMKCLCIRCREIGNKPYNPDKVELKVTDLPAPDAVIEKYIEFSTEDNDILGMLRLRIGDDGKCMVRELHVYGPALGLGAKGNIGTKGQHGGYGRRLVEKAEEIAISQGSNHLSVISGIGVKGYYAKLGYEWDGLYMTKQF
jgi:elongator complex protein 3